MAIISQSGISGITSITSSGQSITFYTASGSNSQLSFDNLNLSAINNGSISGTRNKIFNGDCRIDQRNNGSSGTATGVYTVDRWYYFASQASKGTWQQNAGSVTPPIGFTNYLGYTSSSAYSPLAADIFGLAQAIEGYNISDLAWGTSSAKTVTLSFWVRSSLTGQFGGFLKNGGNLVQGNSNRFCGFSYNINSANTWEYKTITFPGDTSGSWDSTNGSGLAVAFSLGSGSTNIGGTPLTWGSTFYQQPSSSTNIVSTNGATFYITGIQLEIGTVASVFERRSYGQELALCQRYFYSTTSTGSNTQYQNQRTTTSGNYGGAFPQHVHFPVQMRTSPNCTVYTNSTRANSGNVLVNATTASTGWSSQISSMTFAHWNNGALANVGDYYTFYLDASSEL